LASPILHPDIQLAIDHLYFTVMVKAYNRIKSK